ncbi:MAG: hypothetical protein ABEI96_07170 [Haloarculaceae archaeon]
MTDDTDAPTDTNASSDPPGKTSIRPLATVSGRDATIAVREVETPKGTRLELESTERDASVRLDAVALESLTWQDRDTYRSFLHDVDTTARDGDPADVVATSDPADVVATSDPDDGPGGTTEDPTTTRLVEVTNEFAHVVVSEVETGDGDRLELTAPKMDFTVYLNATALAGVAHQSQETFTELLRRRVE